jgi:hypothetical protein
VTTVGWCNEGSGLDWIGWDLGSFDLGGFGFGGSELGCNFNCCDLGVCDLGGFDLGGCDVGGCLGVFLGVCVLGNFDLGVFDCNLGDSVCLFFSFWLGFGDFTAESNLLSNTEDKGICVGAGLFPDTELFCAGLVGVVFFVSFFFCSTYYSQNDFTFSCNIMDMRSFCSCWTF